VLHPEANGANNEAERSLCVLLRIDELIAPAKLFAVLSDERFL
jgi:hypothetical protein